MLESLAKKHMKRARALARPLKKMPGSVLSSLSAEESWRGDAGRVRTRWPTRSAEGNQLYEAGTPWSLKDQTFLIR